jgi:hypothetical protein
MLQIKSLEQLPSVIQFAVQEYLVDNYSEFQPINGGLVHHVYRIKGTTKSAYLKVRGVKCSALPTISIDPADMVYETAAIRLLSQFCPSVFPHLLASFIAEDIAMILMTDVIPQGKTLETALDSLNASQTDIGNLGTTLANVHLKLAQQLSPIRNGNNESYSQKTLYYRFGYHNHPVLDNLIAAHLKYPKQHILGDPSPKNIGIEPYSKITFCDLEAVHIGSRISDLSFLLAHIILHNLTSFNTAMSLAQSFTRNYETLLPIEDVEDFPYLVVGSMLYRLINPVIPYRLRLSTEQRMSKTQQAFELISAPKLTLDKIVETLCSEEEGETI